MVALSPDKGVINKPWQLSFDVLRNGQYWQSPTMCRLTVLRSEVSSEQYRQEFLPSQQERLTSHGSRKIKNRLTVVHRAR